MEWPKESVVSGATFSLVVIQFTYKISLHSFINGKIGSRQTKAKLTIDDIQDIVANRLLQDSSLSHIPGAKDYAIAIEWIEAAIRYKLWLRVITNTQKYR